MQTRSAVIRASLGVSLTTAAYGVSFGAVSVASGLSVAQTCVLSLLLFSGASQFAFAGVIGSGGGVVTATLIAWALGFRNTLYGLQLAAVLFGDRTRRGPPRAVAAQLVIDESAAMASLAKDPDLAQVGFWWTGLGIYLGWNLTTLIGAVAGEQLGDPRTYGLDAAAPAAFLALLWPRLDDHRTRLVAIGAGGVALACTPLLPVGTPVLVAAGVAVLAGWFERLRPEASRVAQ